ncbi:ABC transporter permease [Alkalihalophilus lindianensis]|uniref:ABC transporter permease n=1 Tax=Alkalihalophilus lindianensis TaxID=1630542 RepID=A0ABU3X811_9BACI|nr:ABC transporter permease [Alkalihalophilus lindianensis]MDV2684020.1 ABC transporter permease [Alkalihalophilus lindianensis]
MKVFVDLIKQRTSIIAIGALLLFQLVFGIVWLTSYSEVHQRTELATVGFLSENEALKELIDLENQIDFQVQYYDQLESAISDLQNNEIFLIIYLDEEFATNLRMNQMPSIKYYTNDATSLMVESIVTPIMLGVTASIDKMILLNSTGEMLTALDVPLEQAQEALSVLSSGMNSTVENINPIETHAEKMIPLMVVLSSFVGTMVMAMFMNQSVMALKTKPCCKWKLYISWLIVNLLSAIIVGLVSGFIILISNLNINDFNLLNLWLFQSVGLFSFMLLTALFLIMFNQLGMAVNIFLLSAQLVTSGTLIPQLFLTDFYQELSNWLPATYMASGLYKILFTDLSVTSEIGSLLLAIGISLVAILITLFFKLKLEAIKSKKEKRAVAV